MYSRLSISISVLIAIQILIISCAGGNQDGPSVNNPFVPVTQELSSGNVLQENKSNHFLWSYNLISVDPEEMSAEILPAREVTMHFNILKFMEKGPCFNCVKIAGISFTSDSTLLLDLQFIHPFETANFTGFDVRGIFMFDSGHSFLEAGLTTPDRSSGYGELINADGYTTLFNGNTFGVAPGELQGYFEGNLASTEIPDADLNGYKRNISDDPSNTRNAFLAGDAITTSYEIVLPDGAWVFGYAVDSNWMSATTQPVTDPMNDFPPEANCPEPWKIEVTEEPVGLGLTTAGGSTKLRIDVYDYQGKESYSAPVVECPEIFDGALTADFIIDGAGYSRWEVTIHNDNMPGIGEYKCLISVEDNENASSPDWLDLTAYQLVDLGVVEHPLPCTDLWAETWGGEDNVVSYGIARDPFWNIYMTGYFVGLVDFDPGLGEANLTSHGYSKDVYLSKFSCDGEFIWVRTWGGSLEDEGRDVGVDNSGNVYVTGYYKSEVDFDPSDEWDTRYSDGGSADIFLSKFNPNGDFDWVDTSWDGTSWDTGNGIAVQGNNFIYVSGEWNGNAFLSQRNTDASPNFDLVWEAMNAQGITVDNFGNVFVTGWFFDTVDFDPGPLQDGHSSNGDGDAYLSKFDSGGSFQWARTWGTTSWNLQDEGYSVATDSSGSPYVTGRYEEGNWGFVNKHNANGVFIKEYVWDTSEDYGTGICTDNSGNVYVVGFYSGVCDFDPGPGDDTHPGSWQFQQGILIHFDTSLNFLGAYDFGGEGISFSYDTIPRDVCLYQAGEVLVAGHFNGEIEIDPCAENDDFRFSIGAADAFGMKFDPNQCE